MIGVYWLDNALEILGIVVILAWVVMCLFFWRVGQLRASDTTRPAASSGRGQRLGLVVNPSQPGASRCHSPGPPTTPAGKP